MSLEKLDGIMVAHDDDGTAEVTSPGTIGTHKRPQHRSRGRFVGVPRKWRSERITRDSYKARIWAARPPNGVRGDHLVGFSILATRDAAAD